MVDDQGRPAPGSTVVVFSEDAEHWVPYSRYVKAARPSPDGQFSMVGLPPGTYRALARDGIEHGQWEDRAWLEGARDEGSRFVLVDGATESVRLKVVPSVNGSTLTAMPLSQPR